MSGSPRILICPLDWGLGHAVRCVPIIRELLAQGATPVIAVEGGPLALLQKEFPHVEFVKFSGVPISYPSDGTNMVWSMLRQAPGLLRGIREETRFIKRVVPESKIDAVISDNRFGAYSSTVPSVYITHQIHIQTGNRLTDGIARRQHARYMSRFGSVWIPDVEDGDGISGRLSHGKDIPTHARYIGILSRFHTLEYFDKKYDVTFILSGPEPQRTLLEKMILKEAESFPEKTFMLVRGKNEPPENFPSHIACIPLADAETIRYLYAVSEQIVCRSGYTGIMEMVAAGRSAWLIPTPGQTEQEYLADHLNDKFQFKSISQKGFHLNHILRHPIPSTRTIEKNITAERLEKAVHTLLQTIKKG